MPIKNRLFEIRVQIAASLGHKVTQQQMADLIGIAQAQYSKYERNEEQPDIRTIFKILTKLDRRFEEVFIETE